MSFYGRKLNKNLKDLTKNRRDYRILYDLCKMNFRKIKKDFKKIERIIILGTIDGKKWSIVAKELKEFETYQKEYSKQRIYGIRKSVLKKINFNPFLKIKDEDEGNFPSDEELKKIENENK